MSLSQLSSGALVVYKSAPARITAVSDKIELQTADGKSKKVRPKDVVFLHPGPVASLTGLQAAGADVMEACELLDGEAASLQELAELIFGEDNPATVWTTWELLQDGLYFEGTPEAIVPRDAEAIEKDRVEREAKAKEAQAWQDFLDRLKAGRIEEEDRKALAEVERVALKEIERSRILKAMDLAESPEAAWHMLVKVGYWPKDYNPWPQRMGMPQGIPQMDLNQLPEEDRRDLTHLEAWAIDDVGSTDPDDAIGLDGERIWVHVADAAALVPVDSEADLEARDRGANLYLPEETRLMLPPQATDLLALGLAEESPALSIGFSVDADGRPTDVELCLSRVRVQRTSYDEATDWLDREPFATLAAMAGRFRQRRLENGASRIDLPEVSIKLVDGEPVIRPLPRQGSRDLVTDCMLMAGEAVGRYALEHDIPLPYATQPPPDEAAEPQGMAAMWAYRRKFKRSETRTQPEMHSGLGLEVYTRATSPLRRYLDLVVHQQLRAHLLGQELLDYEALTERVGQSEAITSHIRKAERLANTHWKLVYLRRNADWSGEGVLVEERGRRGTVLIPELALEARVGIVEGTPLNSVVKLSFAEADLVDQVASFRVL